MAHKFLDDKNIDYWDKYSEPDDNGERLARFAKEREIYGFDARECWSLDFTMIALLYERLMKYLEDAGEVIDLDFHIFDYKGEKKTQREMIHLLINLCEGYLTEIEEEYDDDVSMEDLVKIEDQKVADGKEVWVIWNLIQVAMWW